MNKTIDYQAAIDALKGLDFCHYMEFGEYIGEDTREVRLIRAEKAQDALQNLPSAQPERKWIPVTLETLPNPNSVVVVCGKKGTWDYGTYRGLCGDIHSWRWKKNTIKHVYWWMYKTDALPEPFRKEGEL